MAPTTLVGQKATTSPFGRDKDHAGSPIRMSEMLATLEGPAYIERVTVTTPAYIRKAKKAIRKAFETQIEGKGFTMIEVRPPPTNGGLPPLRHSVAGGKHDTLLSAELQTPER